MDFGTFFCFFFFTLFRGAFVPVGMKMPLEVFWLDAEAEFRGRQRKIRKKWMKAWRLATLLLARDAWQISMAIGPMCAFIDYMLYLLFSSRKYILAYIILLSISLVPKPDG
jgi:hypothetical protein